jgi:hypothetical protein
MKNFIFLMLVFVLFPFISFNILNAILNAAGPVACFVVAHIIIFGVIVFIDYAQSNILE